MPSIYARGGKLWCRLKGAKEPGKWASAPTPFAVGDEDKAERYAQAAQYRINQRTSPDAAVAIPATVETYAEKWSAGRKQRGVATADSDLARLRKYALPDIGLLPLAELKPRHVRDLVRKLKTGSLAPRTILSIFWTLHAMYEEALVDELVTANPVIVKPGVLPKKRDKDPTWRSLATYTTTEVMQLITDPRIPVERRVRYAFKAIAGMRHGEVAALAIQQIDFTASPLPRINVVRAFSSASGKIKGTKTEDTHMVPMHPALQALTVAWLGHWHVVYGRAPRPDDLLAPTRQMTPVRVKDDNDALKRDLATLGLRIAAGELRDRGGHDLRSWFLTQTVEDGADSLIIQRMTHAPPRNVTAGYQRFSWTKSCDEIAKLRISISDGDPLSLATVLATGSARARNRWLNVVTPLGLEPKFSA
jgi:integrase